MKKKPVVKDSAVLKAVRNRIKRKDTLFVCFAIDDCGLGTQSQKDSLKEWVRHMLGKASFYEGWLARHHPTICGLRRWDIKWRREVRIKWLDWMIDYCEKEEANGK